MAPKNVLNCAKQRQRSIRSSHFVELEPTIRIGTMYQANIPTGANEDERSDLFRFGRPIPVTWISRKDDGLLQIPDSFNESWTVAERGSFLLALYIFGDNFVMVKDFIENKGMGSLLSYYYGMFYNSQDYKRWLEWTTDRQRRPEYARNILIGWQHKKLFTRLFANASPEHKDSLAMIGRNYLLGILSLREFMFTLRDTIGMNQLVEAVAIGQEERDLLKFPATCDSYVVIPELPTENMFSSHTNQEIIDILKGGGRLSKEKSRHIFCELVWPRLVSKGWCRCKNSRNMVFVVPGIVDFPSKNLKKGIHYFDSMIDILIKVTSEPQLLESESDQEKPPDPDTNQDSVIAEQHEAQLDFNMMELTSSLVTEPANKTEKGPESQLNFIMNHYSDTEERNGAMDGIFKFVNLTSLLPSGDVYITKKDTDKHEVTESSQCVFGKPNYESITNMLYDEVQEQTQLGIEMVPWMVADSDSDDSSNHQEQKNQPDFSNAGVSMVHQRFSTRNRILTKKAFEGFACGYLGPKRKRKDGEKMPSRNVHGKTDPVSSGSENVVEESPE